MEIQGEEVKRMWWLKNVASIETHRMRIFLADIFQLSV